MFKVILFTIKLLGLPLCSLMFVLFPTREYFASYHMETSQLPVKDCNTLAYSSHLRLLSMQGGSLSCHTCCHTGRWFLWSHLKDCPIRSPFTYDKQGALRTYSSQYNLILDCLKIIFFVKTVKHFLKIPDYSRSND